MAQVAHAKDDFILEPPRRTSIRGRADVVVAGGGPAGLAAAIAAARNGARVILIERYTYLGGLLNMDFSSFPGSSTLGLCFQDIGGNRIVGGIAWELVQRLRERGGAVGPVKRTIISNLKGGFLASPHGEFGPKVDSHTLKTVALEMVQEAGIRLLLHTWVVDALMDGGTIRGVMIHSKSGREAILADIVVDATADADVAAAAGAPFDKVPKDQLYRMCVELILANVDTDRARKHLLDHPEQFDYMFLPAADSQIPAEFQVPIWAVVEMGQRGGVKLREDRLAITAGGPRADIMIGFRPGRGSVNVACDGDPTDVEDLTQSWIDGRQKALSKLEWIRQRVPGFENCFVVAESPFGTRESRRILGEYVLTEGDLRQGRRFEDAIGQNSNPMDCHLPGGALSFEALTAPHDIPYRCLLPRNVENLLVAGRCLSADHIAQSSLRKVNACLTMGQAAGTAAALAIRAGITPRQVDVAALQEALVSQGVLLGRGEPPG